MIYICFQIFMFSQIIVIFGSFKDDVSLSGLDGAAGMEDSDLPNLGGEQSLGLDNTGPKLADFTNRPAGKSDAYL